MQNFKTKPFLDVVRNKVLIKCITFLIYIKVSKLVHIKQMKVIRKSNFIHPMITYWISTLEREREGGGESLVL